MSKTTHFVTTQAQKINLLTSATLFAAILLAGLTSSSCKPKEPATPSTPGTMSYQNKTYKLGTAITEYYGLIDTKYHHKIFLLTDSLQITPNQNNYYTLQGKGLAIKLELYTTTRNLNQRYNLENSETITLSVISVDKSKGDTPSTTFSTGMVRVEITSNQVLIEISAQNSQGQTLEATFIGQSYWFDLSN